LLIYYLNNLPRNNHMSEEYCCIDSDKIEYLDQHLTA